MITRLHELFNSKQFFENKMYDLSFKTKPLLLKSVLHLVNVPACHFLIFESSWPAYISIRLFWYTYIKAFVHVKNYFLNSFEILMNFYLP